MATMRKKAKRKVKKISTVAAIGAAVTGLGQMAKRKAQKRAAENIFTGTRKRRAKKAGL